MTHGTGKTLSARNGTYSEEEIFKQFTSGRCPGLKDKPKLFFVLACRGNQHDRQNDITEFLENVQPNSGEAARSIDQSETDAKSCTHIESTFVEAHKVDVMMMHSTQPGYVSIRDINQGSWFIQALCTEFHKWKHDPNGKDLMQILQSVIRLVSSHDIYGEKQTPVITSSLTRTFIIKNKKQLSLNQTYTSLPQESP